MTDRPLPADIDRRSPIRYFDGDGLLHREDGPAYEETNGTRFWYLNGRRHREDGPAVERSDGSREWYLHGEPLSETEFEARRPIPSTPSFSRDQFMDWAELDEEDLERRFRAQPIDRSEMSANINTVLEAMAAHGEPNVSWSLVFDVSSGAVDEYGFLEDSRDRIVRATLDDLAEWDQTSGWDQVLSIRRGISAAFRQ